MATLACPHNTPEVRQCIGCPRAADDIIGIVHFEGEIIGRVEPDQEGVGVWAMAVLRVEVEDSTCGCTLTEDEDKAIGDKLLELAPNEFPEDW